MYINNYDSWQGFGQSNRHYLYRKKLPMNKLLSCHYNMDTNRVEARFEDSIPLAINCITVEDVTRELEKRHVIDHKVKQERMQ